MPINLQSIIENLKELGTTSEEVKNNLISLKIKGRRTMITACPIARYLLSKDIELAKNDVPFYVIGYSPTSQPEKDAITISGKLLLVKDYPWLQGIVDFIHQFDRGQHSECVEEDHEPPAKN